MDTKAKRRMILLAMASALATVGIAWLAVKASGQLPRWVLAAAGSPQALRYLLIMIGGTAALALLTVALLRVRGRRPRGAAGFHGDQGGTAAVEMAFVFPLALMIFLVIAQAALLFNANMVVHYAAFAAARVATVVVPMEIGQELRNLVYNPGFAGNSTSEKLAMIRRAAVVALMPVSAAVQVPPADSGGTAIQTQSSAVWKYFGVTDQRPWFLWGSKPSYEPFFKRAKTQYDYANGQITIVSGESAGQAQVTNVELMKPAHWRTPPEAHSWNLDKVDGGFAEADWDPAQVSNPDEDCPYKHQRRGDWGDWGWNYISYCPFYPERMDYWYWEDLNVRVTYQYLLQVPYANRFLGDEVQVPSTTGKQYATQIRVVVSLSNEGGPELRPQDYVPPS